jgi:alkylated DNA repair dioxygenase AlkB
MQPLEQDQHILYDPHFYSCVEATQLYARLREELEWRQDQIHIYGRSVCIPRLQAFIAEPGLRYTYSGLTLEGVGFPAVLAAIQTEIRQRLGVHFNAVLANLYRDGSDTMGWHSDDEAELGPAPIIASLTLGAERSFKFRPKGGGDSWGIELQHGSLLLMGSGVQNRWQHSVPKRARCQDGRINLTFRQIIEC